MNETRLEQRLTDTQVATFYFTILFGGAIAVMLLL